LHPEMVIFTMAAAKAQLAELNAQVSACVRVRV
jgi:hypothetical protein